MKKHKGAKKDIGKAGDLPQWEAEERLKKKDVKVPQEADTQALFHELQVQQIELETQNEELRLSQAQTELISKKYTDLFDFAPVGYFSIDETGTITEANLTAAAMFGWRKYLFMKKRLNTFVAFDSLPAFNSFLNTVFSSSVKQSCEAEMERADGSKFFAGLEGLAYRDEKNNKALCRLAVIDITERISAQQEIYSAKTYFESILKNSMDMIVTLGKDGTIKYANPQAEISTGYSLDKIKGMHFLEFIPENLKEFMINKFRETLSGGSGMYETQIIRPDGVLMDCLVSRSVIEGREEVLAIIKDITLIKAAEKEREKLRKLESVGVLAGGIAHDFNNILFTLTLNLAVAKLHKHSSEEVADLLTKAETVCEKAKELADRLITFAAGGSPFPENICAATLVRETVSAIAETGAVKTEFFFPKELPHVKADPRQFSQVIKNLAFNAVESMPEGGTIRVSGENVRLDKNNQILLKEGDYVKISIQDSGVGIPEENLQKIFDPYFSTKERSSIKGMGLGLSVCHSIVQKHKGAITVDSKPGAGATFHIYLPAAESNPP